MKIMSKSQLKSNEKFNLNLFKEPFCSKELQRFKRFETIKKYKYCPFCGDKIIRGEDHQ